MTIVLLSIIASRNPLFSSCQEAIETDRWSDRGPSGCSKLSDWSPWWEYLTKLDSQVNPRPMRIE